MNATARAAAAYDCIVIGGGHNGLACAAYLARAGRSVLVLEAAARVGGAAVTREFAPGYRVSACAHLLHQFPAPIAAELALERHGLRLAATAIPTVALAADGAPLVLGATQLEGAPDEARAYALFMQRMGTFARLLEPVLGRVPPQLGTSNWADRRELLGLGWRLRRLGRRDMRELLRIGGMNVHDLLVEHFSSPLLQGALAFDAVLGTNFGPRSPGTVLSLLYRLAAQSGAGGQGTAQPIGGMGAVSDALAAAAQAAGAVIRTGGSVSRVIVERDVAAGVVLESGERIAGRAVISNADPKTTLLRLLGTEHLDTGFVRRVHHLRTRGLAAKLHVALDGLPASGTLEASRLGRLLIAPSLEYVEHAYNHSKYGECSAAPALEVTVPTVSDPTLAPAGHHVLSIVAQYAPYELRGGWEGQREPFIARILDLLERQVPGLRRRLRAVELLTPLDIEREFRIGGGHWHHADLAFDQFYMLRPVPGAAQYRTPLPGLYLCGAGCHPGGGVMGLAGRNAARQVLAGAA